MKVSHIWTDGSLRKGEAISAVWFADKSPLNVTFFARGQQQVFNGEILAIEYALATARSRQSVCIVSDSKVSVEAIQKSYQWNRKQWSKCPFSAALRRIMRLCTHRALAGQNTTFLHVFAHLLDDRTKLDVVCDPNAASEYNRKIAKMQTIAPLHWQWLLKGNQQADLLTHQQCCNRNIQLGICEGLPRFTLQHTDGRIMEGNILKEMRLSILACDRKAWYLRAPKQTELIRDIRVDWNATKYPIGETNDPYKTRSSFVHKLYQNLLPVKRTQHVISRGYYEKQNPECKNNDKYLKKYNTTWCNACHFTLDIAISETRQHLFSDCPCALVQNDAMATALLKCAAKYHYHGTLPWWFSTSCTASADNSPLTRALLTFPKEWGNLGVVPQALRTLSKYCINEPGAADSLWHEWRCIIKHYTYRKWTARNQVMVDFPIQEISNNREFMDVDALSFIIPFADEEDTTADAAVC